MLSKEQISENTAKINAAIKLIEEVQGTLDVTGKPCEHCTLHVHSNMPEYKAHGALGAAVTKLKAIRGSLQTYQERANPTTWNRHG